VENRILGSIGTSEEIRNSVNRITPYVVLSPELAPTREMIRITAQLYIGEA
jgi:hypothetical protein